MPAISYMPEMKEQRPADAQLDADRAYGGGWRIKAPAGVELPKYRGLTYERTLTARDLVPQAQHRVGTKVYYATDRAFKWLGERYVIAVESLLD